MHINQNQNKKVVFMMTIEWFAYFMSKYHLTLMMKNDTHSRNDNRVVDLKQHLPRLIPSIFKIMVTNAVQIGCVCVFYLRWIDIIRKNTTNRRAVGAILHEFLYIDLIEFLKKKICNNQFLY